MTSTEFTTSATDRANKVLSFDSSGELAVTQELGTFRGNWAASTAYEIRDLVKDTSTNNIFIVTEAHTSSGSQPLTTNTNSAKYTLIVDAATATTQATNAASSATAAASSATTATTKASEASTFVLMQPAQQQLLPVQLRQRHRLHLLQRLKLQRQARQQPTQLHLQLQLLHQLLQHLLLLTLKY